MGRRWWILGDGLEETSFKRVSEGWVFAAPIWPRRSYLVNDAQKEELAKRLRWMYRLNFIATVLIVSILVPATKSGLVSWAVIAAFAASSILFMMMFIRFALHPKLSGLTPTNRSITRMETIKTQAATLPYSAILILEIISISLLVPMISLGLTSEWNSINFIGTLMFGVCSLYFPMLLLIKARLTTANP